MKKEVEGDTKVVSSACCCFAFLTPNRVIVEEDEGKGEGEAEGEGDGKGGGALDEEEVVVEEDGRREALGERKGQLRAYIQHKQYQIHKYKKYSTYQISKKQYISISFSTDENVKGRDKIRSEASTSRTQ